MAHRWNQSTRFGAFLTLWQINLLAIAMVLVTEHYHSWWVTLPAATMIAREIIICRYANGWRSSGKRSSVAVLAWIGKVKPLPRWWRWHGCCRATFRRVRRYCACGCGTDSVVNVKS
ncbi:hypothetical protein ACNKHT_12390 [Shigella flexneri]